MKHHKNIDLLNEERHVITQHIGNRHGGHVDWSHQVVNLHGYATGMTITSNVGIQYAADYNPDKYQEKKYSEEDVDKIVGILTLFIDDLQTRIQVEEAYQSMKDQQKI